MRTQNATLNLHCLPVLLALWLPLAAAQDSAEPPLQAALTAPVDDPEAARIIRAADRIRAPDAPFRYLLDLIEIKDDVVVAQQQLDVAMRIAKPDAQHPGDAKALVRFLEPKRDQGKALLADVDKLWFYDPRLRRPIPISRQQRLIGQVANGDVVAADFDLSYASIIAGTERCGDVQCYKLNLQRRWPFVTYPKITYWVEVESMRPFKAEFLSTTGLVMKTAYYQDYRPALGEVRPHEIVIVNALQKNHFTRMLYSKARFEEIPEAYFQREYLERLR